MARNGVVLVALACGTLLLNLAHAYLPAHVKRQLLTPEYDGLTMSTQQHVAYSDPDSSKHVMVQYEAQQHMHLRTWSLDTILGLQGVTTQHGN